MEEINPEPKVLPKAYLSNPVDLRSVIDDLLDSAELERFRLFCLYGNPSTTLSSEEAREFLEAINKHFDHVYRMMREAS